MNGKSRVFMPKGKLYLCGYRKCGFGGVQVFDVNKNGSLTAKARLDTEDVYSTVYFGRETGKQDFCR